MSGIAIVLLGIAMFFVGYKIDQIERRLWALENREQAE